MDLPATLLPPVGGRPRAFSPMGWAVPVRRAVCGLTPKEGRPRRAGCCSWEAIAKGGSS